jgi:hypothetical protein
LRVFFATQLFGLVVETAENERMNAMQQAAHFGKNYYISFQTEANPRIQQLRL